jgi:DNA-binding NarL/FixJ family response regulator
MSSHPQLPYRVLLVDDVPEVREALRWALETESDLVVVGEAGTGVDALTCAMSLTPDVVILDIELPALDGYAVTRAVKALAHPPIIIFLTVHSDPLSRRWAAEAGGDGFAEKEAGWPALITEVRHTLRARGW